MKDASSLPLTPENSEEGSETSSTGFGRFQRPYRPRLVAAILSWLFYTDPATGFLSGFRNSYRNAIVHDYIGWDHCDWCYMAWERTPYFSEDTPDDEPSTPLWNKDSDEVRMFQSASGTDEGDSSTDKPSAE